MNRWVGSNRLLGSLRLGLSNWWSGERCANLLGGKPGFGEAIVRGGAR